MQDITISSLKNLALNGNQIKTVFFRYSLLATRYLLLATCYLLLPYPLKKLIQQALIIKEWYFRHDKIMDYFLVQNFLGDSDEIQSRLEKHIGDPRFRGVYFLLANLLKPDPAFQLRESLIQYAADTNDHTVSDTFVKLLRSRVS